MVHWVEGVRARFDTYVYVNEHSKYEMPGGKEQVHSNNLMNSTRFKYCLMTNEIGSIQISMHYELVSLSFYLMRMDRCYYYCYVFVCFFFSIACTFRARHIQSNDWCVLYTLTFENRLLSNSRDLFVERSFRTGACILFDGIRTGVAAAGATNQKKTIYTNDPNVQPKQWWSVTVR